MIFGNSFNFVVNISKLLFQSKNFAENFIRFLITCFFRYTGESIFGVEKYNFSCVKTASNANANLEAVFRCALFAYDLSNDGL